MPELRGLPASFDGRGAAGRGEPALELRLLSGGHVFRDLKEFRRAARHRYVLANCAGLTFPAIVLLYALDSTEMPIDLQVPSVVVGMVAAQMLVIAYLAGAVRLARLLCKNAQVIQVWVTPGIMVGAAGMLGVVHVMHGLMDVQHDWTELRSHLIPFFCVLYLEIAATILFRGPVPRALAKLRAGEGLMAAQVAATQAQVPVEAPSVPTADKDPDPPVALDIAQAVARRLGVPATDVLRLEASGNYVTIVTRKGRQLVPGPFSAIAAMMPAALGRQVQRSHWVSLAAVDRVRRQGREVYLQLTCGALVPVSVALRADVQAWLEAGGKLAGSPRGMALRVSSQEPRRLGTWSGAGRKDAGT